MESKPPKKANQLSSRLSGFYKKLRGERVDLVKEFSNLPVDQVRLISQDGALDFQLTDLFVENAIGNYPLPFGIVTSFKINSKDYIIPMAVEESSVIAATSNAARLIYSCGGFKSSAQGSHMIGQIQLLDIQKGDYERVNTLLQNKKQELLAIANECQPRLKMRGGGAFDLELRDFSNGTLPFLVLHILIDTKDAMGANLVNTICEHLAPCIEKLTGLRSGLKILSNLATGRLYKASCKLDPKILNTQTKSGAYIDGSLVAERIVEAFHFANTDPYRAATHNKGIMNGIDPIVIATGNDWRAVEAGAHAYAAQDGFYRSLSKWSIDKEGFLIGELEIPLQIGTVGGVTRLHPLAKLSMQILNYPKSKDLAQIIACSGLAANFAALKALVTNGIQRGHMKLHAKNLALAAGARGKEVEVIASQMVKENQVSAGHAEELLKIRAQKLQTAKTAELSSIS